MGYHDNARLSRRAAGMAILKSSALGGVLLSGCTSRRDTRPTPMPPPPLLSRNVAFTGIPSDWHRHDLDSAVQWTSPWLITDQSWDEVIVSWNVQPPEGTSLEVEVRAHPFPTSPPTDANLRWFSLGTWTLEESGPVTRTSHRGQADDQGTVKTDTFVVRQPHQGLQLRLHLHGSLASDPARLRLLTVSFCRTDQPPTPAPPRSEVWGTTLDVPERSQVAYLDGRAWCSPTSISMILAWWARVLNRPDLDLDVPQVARAVHDPGWGGTGNWPFNTALAGSLPGLRGAALRLPNLTAVESLVAHGIPVVISVNAPALRGRPKTPDGGHLVIIVGFTDTGDPVVNDPWARLDQGQRVRRTYHRDHLIHAWTHAHRLAYVVSPDHLLHSWPVNWMPS